MYYCEWGWEWKLRWIDWVSWAECFSQRQPPLSCWILSWSLTVFDSNDSLVGTASRTPEIANYFILSSCECILGQRREKSHTTKTNPVEGAQHWLNGWQSFVFATYVQYIHRIQCRLDKSHYVCPFEAGSCVCDYVSKLMPQISKGAPYSTEYPNLLHVTCMLCSRIKERN